MKTTREQKIQLLKDIQSGVINPADFRVRQLHLYFTGEYLTYKLDDETVTKEQWSAQWEKQFKIGRHLAGKDLFWHVDGVLR